MARTTKTPGVQAPEPAPIETAPDDTIAPEIPNAIDIDPATITAPVLTKQGWVTPIEKPHPAQRF